MPYAKNSRLPAVRGLLLVTVLLFIAQSYVVWLYPLFALWMPGTPRFHPSQLVTYAFLHGSWLHLGLNMLGLWMFGAELERLWGGRRLLLTYLISCMTAAMTQIVVTSYLTGYAGPMVGASGGVFGLMLAYALYFPQRRIALLIPPVQLRARTFVLVYAGLELLLGVTGTQQGVAHFAHLGGLFGGWVSVQYFRGRGVFGGQRKASPGGH